MIESWRKSIYDAICSKRSQASFEEFGFFTDKFKPIEQRDHEILEKGKSTGRITKNLLPIQLLEELASVFL